MFGFLKRWRAASAAADEPPPPAAAPDEALDDRPGKSWFSSSLDLHDGLDISDIEEETTEPMPLFDNRKKQ